MYYKLLITIFFFGLLGCQKPLWKQQIKGFKSYSKQEFWYKWYGTNSAAAKAQTGQQIQINYTILKGTKVLQTSFGSLSPIYVEMPKVQFDNFFTKALRLMAVGDSLHIKIKAENITDLLGDFVHEFEEGELVDFYYKCYAIKSAKAHQKEVAMQQNRIDSIQNKIKNLIEDYLINPSEANIQYTPSKLGYILFPNAPLTSRQPQEGQTVKIHYICYTQEGLIIDNSLTNRIPLDFVVGTSSFIQGISEGVQLMKEQQTAFLVVPPVLAYGKEGSADIIAPNSTLFFYIELLSID